MEKRAEDPLKHSRRPFGGIWKDLKKLASRYRSDITDAFNVQVFFSIIFVYITLLGPALAFGALMEEVTLNVIGETETLLATGLAGVVYGLLAVQPVSILAFTGPVLLFETIVYRVLSLRVHVQLLIISELVISGKMKVHVLVIQRVLLWLIHPVVFDDTVVVCLIFQLG